MRTCGFVASGFEQVRKEFDRNFVERGDIGAAFAATRDGEVVVDLWGGVSDEAESTPWDRDTAAVIFSGTKGLVATCLLLLVEHGEIDLDAPVAKYWPEFAQGGKAVITVADAASHRARLPGIRTPLDESDLTDDRKMARLLAEQKQEDDPRAALAYHALTYGWLCGELVRRVTGLSIGQFFAHEIARPLGLDVWIGLPSFLESRVATLCYAPAWGSQPQLDETQLAVDGLLQSVWGNPPLFPRDHNPWNTQRFHSCEIPGVNGIGTARSLARLYGCLACGGEIDGVRLLSEPTLRRGTTELCRFQDPFVDEPMAYAVGFELQTELERYGPPQDAFGSAGAGGSVHGAWPSTRVGFSYVMNQMRDDPMSDSRSRVLLRALNDAVERQTDSDDRARRHVLWNRR